MEKKGKKLREVWKLVKDWEEVEERQKKLPKSEAGYDNVTEDRLWEVREGEGETER